MANPVYKVLNKPLTIMGTDRRLFFAALTLSATLWTGFDTLLGAIICWVVLMFVARYITKTDPQYPRIVLNSGKWRAAYDPMRYKPHNFIWQRR